MEDHLFSKVEILLEQKRFSEAEKILGELLANQPNNVDFLFLLSEVKLGQGQTEQALTIIDQAIGISPDASHLFYTKARIHIANDNKSEAEILLRHAIQLDPYDADYFAFLAQVKLMQKEFEEALKMADQALEKDAENLLALNARSTALTKLNRDEESFQTIEGALRDDPNNSFTHTNYGWNLLEQGNHKKALVHFKEALTQDPDNSNAQSGMLEAIKASNPLYRWFLKYAFWLGNMAAKNQWAVIIGFYLFVRVLRTIAKTNEALDPFLTPIIILLSVIAFSTWVIDPISNLFLRFNKYGKVLLSKREKLSSNFVASSLLLGIASILLAWLLADERMYYIAIFFISMMVPFSKLFSFKKNPLPIQIYTGLLFLCGTIAVFQLFITNSLSSPFITIYMLGFIAFQWIVNYFLIREDN